MDDQQPSRDKFLINCDHGPSDVERATIAFILAVTASKTAETAMFMTSDAARLCVKGITAGDLIAGAEIAGAPRTMAFLAGGARLLA